MTERDEEHSVEALTTDRRLPLLLAMASFPIVGLPDPEPSGSGEAMVLG